MPKEVNMTNLYDPFFDIFNTGIDQLRPERFLSLDDKVQRYPLTNIGRDKDNNLIVEVACAGFSLNELSIETNNDVIVIKGHHEEKTSDKNSVKYIQEHISTSDFTRNIILTHPMYIGGETTANYKNGILTITVKPVEEKKPKTVKIFEGLPFKEQKPIADSTKEELDEAYELNAGHKPDEDDDD